MPKDESRLFNNIPEAAYERVFERLQEMRSNFWIKTPTGPGYCRYRDDQLLMLLLCQQEPEYLESQVHMALENAYSGGHEDWVLGTKVEDIAEDMLRNEPNVEGREVYELTPHILSWFRNKGIEPAQFSNEELSNSL